MNIKNILWFYLLLVLCADANKMQEDRKFKTVVFAIDPSITMDTHLSINQAIIIWTKRFAPKYMNIGIVYLSIHKRVAMFNLSDETALDDIIGFLSEYGIYSHLYLRCGLTNVDELVRERPAGDNTSVLVMTEESQNSIPPDTLTDILEEIKPTYVTSTIALTNKSIPDLEILAEVTNGTTDYINYDELRFAGTARFLQSFFLLPVSTDFQLVMARDCTSPDCSLSFEVGSTASELLVLACPLKLGARILNVTISRLESQGYPAGDLTWNSQTNCWHYLEIHPQKGVWGVSTMALEKDEVSIIVSTKVTQDDGRRPLRCWTSAGASIVDASVQDVRVFAELSSSAVPLDDFSVHAYVDSPDGSRRQYRLSPHDEGTYSSCVSPGDVEGRHAVVCEVTNADTGGIMFSSQGNSFKVKNLPSNWPVDTDFCNLAQTESAENVPEDMSRVTKHIHGYVPITPPVPVVYTPKEPPVSEEPVPSEVPEIPRTPEVSHTPQVMVTSEANFVTASIPQVVTSTVQEGKQVFDTISSTEEIKIKVSNLESDSSTLVTIALVGIIVGIIVVAVFFVIYFYWKKSHNDGQENGTPHSYTVN